MKHTYTRKKITQTSTNEEEQAQDENIGSTVNIKEERLLGSSETYIAESLKNVTSLNNRETEQRKDSTEQSPCLKLEKYRQAKLLAETAIKENKIFTIYGNYPVIRNSLRKRGWAERIFPTIQNELQKNSHQVHDDTSSAEGKMLINEGREWTTKQLTGCYLADETEESSMQEDVELDEEDDVLYALQHKDTVNDMMSRLVRKEMPSFIWTVKRDVIDYHHLTKDQMLNHYGRTGCFTTKIGLCLNLRNLPWYVEANPDTFFPRCYNLSSQDEMNAFIDDFRRTTVCSILKWVVLQSSKQHSLVDLEKKLSQEIIHRAYSVCENYLGRLRHEDIDLMEDSPQCLDEAEWNDLIRQYYNIIHEDAYIESSDYHIAQCQEMLNRIELINPQLSIEGIRNVWIIKPGAKSRGRDIVCMDKMEEILQLIKTDPCGRRDHKWVIQKYIEMPLLIYNTKFDIRQWFLVTDWNPLTVWFYKDCYLRFSTQHFTLEKLDSCIHLCNNSIQKHFKNCTGRNPQLPGHNMWGSAKFRDYLENRGYGDVWESVIYPSMKKAISYTMRMVQDSVEHRKNSFELYGADFIIGENFQPWLIEINSSPTLFPSTPITAHLCAQVQEDLIKVIIDRQIDKSCDIGKFELLLRQPAVDVPLANGTSLIIEGTEIARPNSAPLVLPAVKCSSGYIPLQHRTKPSSAPYDERMADSSTSLTRKPSAAVRKERLLPSTINGQAKGALMKHPKSKSAPLEPALKKEQSGFPAFKIMEQFSPTKAKPKTQVSSGKYKNEPDLTPRNASAVDWTVLPPPKASDNTAIDAAPTLTGKKDGIPRMENITPAVMEVDQKKHVLSTISAARPHQQPSLQKMLQEKSLTSTNAQMQTAEGSSLLLKHQQLKVLSNICSTFHVMRFNATESFASLQENMKRVHQGVESLTHAVGRLTERGPSSTQKLTQMLRGQTHSPSITQLSNATLLLNKHTVHLHQDMLQVNSNMEKGFLKITETIRGLTNVQSQLKQSPTLSPDSDVSVATCLTPVQTTLASNQKITWGERQSVPHKLLEYRYH